MNTNERIRNRRKQLGLTQAEVAKAIGISRVSVTQWESGETSPKGENFFSLCKELQVAPNWLLYGDEDGKLEAYDFTKSTPRSHLKIPLYSLHEASLYASEYDHDISNLTVTNWIKPLSSISPRAFAVKAKGNAMLNPFGAPSIPEGVIVIFDPELTYQDGHIVLAMIQGTHEATIKKFVMDGPNQYLMPLNPDFKPILIDDSCTIIATAVKAEFNL